MTASTRCHRIRFFSLTAALQHMPPEAWSWFCPFCRHWHREQWSEALVLALQGADVREVYVLSSVEDEELGEAA